MGQWNPLAFRTWSAELGLGFMAAACARAASAASSASWLSSWMAAKMSCTVSRRHAACSDEYNPPCQHTRRGCDRLHAIRRAMRARAVFGGGGEHEGDGPAQ
jgi:hypothetical protein